jgi:hypothetical protein
VKEEKPGRRRSAYSLPREPVARTPRCVQAPVAGAAGTERHHHSSPSQDGQNQISTDGGSGRS